MFVAIGTKRYYPDTCLQQVTALIDKIENEIGKTCIHSIFYSCNLPKIKVLNHIYQKYFQFEPRSSKMNIGLLDDDNKCNLPEAKAEGFSTFLATPNDTQYIDQLRDFVEVPEFKEVPAAVSVTQAINNSARLGSS